MHGQTAGKCGCGHANVSIIEVLAFTVRTFLLVYYIGFFQRWGGWTLVILSDKFSNSVAAAVRDKLECIDFIAALDVVRDNVPDDAFISFIGFRELILVEDFMLSGFFGIGSRFWG